MKSIVQITETAKNRITKMMNTNEENLLKISIVSKGCSGYRYDFKFVKEYDKLDEILSIDNDKKIIIDGKSVLHLIGLELDWIEKDNFSSQFVFNNPNVDADTLCGCGESFSLNK